jgi:hypothetical protein
VERELKIIHENCGSVDVHDCEDYCKTGPVKVPKQYRIQNRSVQNILDNAEQCASVMLNNDAL